MELVESNGTEIHFGEFPATSSDEEFEIELNRTKIHMDEFRGLYLDEIYIHVILEILIIIPTILGNILILISVSKFPSLRSRSNILIANLGVADLFVGFILIPINVMDMLWKDVSSEDLLCFLELSLFTCFLTASVFNNFVISLERFCFICFPLWYARKFKKHLLYILVAVMWSLAVAISAVPYFGLQRHPDFLTPCSVDFAYKTEYVMFLSAVIVSSILLSFSMYGCVIKTALSQLGKTKSSRKNRKLRRYAKRTWIMMVIFIVFVICWTPYVVLVILGVFSAITRRLLRIRQWTKLIGLFNSGVNWIIYGLMNTRFVCILTCNCDVNFSRLSATDSIINPTIRKSTIVRKSTIKRTRFSTMRFRLSKRSDHSTLVSHSK